MSDLLIRPLAKDDLYDVKLIIDENELFPSELIDEMTLPFLSANANDFWMVVLNNSNQVIAVAYYAPERMTDGTWNLLLMAVSPAYQRGGVGLKLVQAIQNHLTELGARILLVETSGMMQFKSAREFYSTKCGFKQIAVIPEFYEKGDDKVIFHKWLTR